MKHKINKAVLIGLDAATLDMIQKYSKKGALPNLTKLMKEGFTTEALCALPPATSVNWNTISTGAYAGTHGVTSMAMINPRGRLEEYTSGFSSRHCKVEHIWDVAERVGKKPILLKYTTSWPPTIKKGIQVGGYADPDCSIFAICPKTLYTDEYNEIPWIFGGTKAPGRKCALSFQVKFRLAKNWPDIPETKLTPLEAELQMAPIEGKPKRFYILVVNDKIGSGYNSVIISPTKSMKEKWGQIRVGEFSPWIRESFQTSGGEKEGIFRFKLYFLAPDASKIRLYQSMVFPPSGWTFPESLGPELTREIGPYQPIAGMPVPGRWMERPQQADYFVDEFGYQGEWLSKAAQYLMSRYEWHLFMTQFHAIDLTNHSFFDCLKPEDPFHEKGSEMIEKAYMLSDAYVGEILKEVEDDALVMIVSDHGYIEHQPGIIDINRLLAKHGLLFYKEKQVLIEDSMQTGAGTGKAFVVDWTKTKAFESGNFIWINLKGRQPNGIVDAKDYDSLCNEIVRIIESATPSGNPHDKYAQIVLRREDAEAFGLWGENVGDVIYFAKACFKGGHHGNFHTSRGRYGSMRAVTIIKGPGIRAGMINPKPINLVDIAPTMAYALSIPIPKNAEGRVLREIWE